MFSEDTSADSRRILIALLRRSPVWKRLKMVSDLNETIRALARADIQRRYPRADSDVIQRRLAARALTREELIATYGWDPTDE